MQFDHLMATGYALEAVHILSDKREVLHLSFYLDEEMMGGVRSAFRDGRSAETIKTPCQSRVLSEGYRGCEIFSAMILPKASFTSKGGDTALG
jgi:hypothetical protein